MADPRDDANELLHELSATFPTESGVTAGRMFNGQGLKAGGKFFAFVSSTGRLVVKVPEPRVRELVEHGDATEVTMGKRTMREWVSLSPPEDGDSTAWRAVLEEARRFVAGASG